MKNNYFFQSPILILTYLLFFLTSVSLAQNKTGTIKGTIKLPYEQSETFKATDASKEKLKNAWLKG